MIYLDTSVLVPLFVPDVESASARRCLIQGAKAPLAISDWSLTEFASAIGIRVRERALRARQGHQVCSAMRDLAQSSLVTFSPTRDDFERAAGYLEQHELGLRAGDVLHLAIAQARGGRIVYSFDRKFVTAGRKLGINTVVPE